MALSKRNAAWFDGAGEREGEWPVLGAGDLDDPFMRIHAGVLGPGASIPLHRYPAEVEEAYILLDGGARLLDGAQERPVPRPAVAGAFCGGGHGLANPGGDPLRYFRVVVGPDEEAVPGAGPEDRPPVLEAMNPALVEEFWAHDGLGRIRFRRLWDHDSFCTRWGFVDHCLVPPGTSVGYHRHDTVQECYLILGGEGTMKVDGRVGRVVPGDCIPNRIGGSHGLINGGPEPVEFINVCLCLVKGEWDATNLGDDLSDLI